MKDKIQEICDLFLTENSNEIGLLSGFTGEALFLFYAAKYFHLRQETYNKKAYQLLDRLYAEIAKPDFNFIHTHCAGIAGVGWAFEHIEKTGFIETDTNELLIDFDEILYRCIKQEMNVGNYDFLHGGIGIGLYYINRLKKTDTLLHVLQNLINDIEKLAEQNSDNTIKWLSMIDHYKKRMGYNISLSHGMSSIVAVLSKLYNIDSLNKSQIVTLLNSAVGYILNQEIDKDKYGSYFPNLAIESLQHLHGSRLAWCYGDLGIAMALWQAGEALQNMNWIDKAMEILLYAATKRRNLQNNMVIDAGLCHGTAGIALIFYRAWWNSQLSEFKSAADNWFNETLKMAKFNDGLAGYKAWRTPEFGGWINDYGILEGVAGIGLAMLSYFTETEPTWDECLLLS